MGPDDTNPLPEPGPARRSAHRIPSAVRTAARLTVSNGPTTKCPETHARSGKRPEVPRKQVDAGPDDTNRSRNRSPKRPQYSGRDAVFPIRQAIDPDSTTRQSPPAAPLPVNAPQDGGIRNRPPSRYGGTGHRHTILFRQLHPSIRRGFRLPSSNPTADFRSHGLRIRTARSRQTSRRSSGKRGPHGTSEYAVTLYQAGISPVQSSARPQPFEARRPVNRPTNPSFRKDRKSYRGGREHRPPPSAPGPKTKNGGHPKQRAPSRKL